MSRRRFNYDLDHGTTKPLPPKVEAWLDQKATEQQPAALTDSAHPTLDREVAQ